MRSIEEHVSAFRRAIEEADKGKQWCLPEGFPRASCKPASMLLAYYLVNEVGCKPGNLRFVSAQRWSDREVDPIERSHFWLEYSGLIVDITADQFPEVGEPAIVTPDRGWHDSWFPSSSYYPYTEEIMDRSKNRVTYQQIISALG